MTTVITIPRMKSRNMGSNNANKALRLDVSCISLNPITVITKLQTHPTKLPIKGTTEKISAALAYDDTFKVASKPLFAPLKMKRKTCRISVVINILKRTRSGEIIIKIIKS